MLRSNRPSRVRARQVRALARLQKNYQAYGAKFPDAAKRMTEEMNILTVRIAGQEAAPRAATPARA